MKMGARQSASELAREFHFSDLESSVDGKEGDCRQDCRIDDKTGEQTSLHALGGADGEDCA